MNEPRSHLARDLQALQYVDAVNAGDLEAVGALWEEASGDPELERILTELDGAFCTEGAAGHRTSATEAGPWSRRQRWAEGVMGIAAAGFLAILAWPASDHGKPRLAPRPDEPVRPIESQPSHQAVRVATWRQYQRTLDDDEIPAFRWPLQGDSSELGIRLSSPESARVRGLNRSL